jgi:hypothetical protein
MKRNTRIAKRGKPVSPRYSFSRSFDNGEILVQKTESRKFQEYVVQSSITDIPFEEYIVYGHCEPAKSAEKATAPSHLAPAPDGQPQQPPKTAVVTDGEKPNPPHHIEAPVAANEQQAPTPVADTKKEVPSTQASFEYVDTPRNGSNDSDEDNFARDMQAILNGEKVFNPQTKAIENKNLQNPHPPPPQPHHNNATSLDQLSNQHAIFDQIAKSMEYAKAYDLGSIDLDKRFADFNKAEDYHTALSAERNTIPSTSAAAREVLGSEAFLEDLNAIAKPGIAKERQVTNASTPYQAVKTTDKNGGKYSYENPSLVMSQSASDYSYAQTPAMIGGVAVADAIQIGLGAASIVQTKIADTHGGFTLSFDKAERLLTNEARMHMPGAQQTKQSYSRELFWIGELKKGFADASVIIEWEGNPYGEISTVMIRRDLKNSTEWTKSSANTSISKVNRIPLPGTDPRAWPLVYTYEGTFDPAGNGHYEYSGEFEINAFGGLTFIRHEVMDRSMIEWAKMGGPEDYVRKGTNYIVPVPAIPKEQIDYLRSRLP